MRYLYTPLALVFAPLAVVAAESVDLPGIGRVVVRAVGYASGAIEELDLARVGRSERVEVGAVREFPRVDLGQM